MLNISSEGYLIDSYENICLEMTIAKSTGFHYVMAFKQ